MVKDLSIKSYIKDLTPSLCERYGYSKSFTKGQVDKTLEILNLNIEQIKFAYAMFLSEEDFNNIDEIDEAYSSLRHIVKEQYFSNQRSFNLKDLMNFSKPGKLKPISGHDLPVRYSG